MEPRGRQTKEKGEERSRQTYLVVLTGGPCAGKTSSLELISDHFNSLGWRVFQVREAATVVLSGGVDFSSLGEDQVFRFQKNILRVILALEQTYLDLAHDGAEENTLILCDRGLMDVKAYCSGEMWERLLASVGLTEEEARDLRYDAVVHLVTAAKGAKEFYTQLNNSTRSEGPDLAVQLDSRTQGVWSGHPHFHIIDNSTSFKEKIIRAVACICRRVGVPPPAESFRKHKFLYPLNSKFDLSNLNVKESLCEYIFLMLSEKGRPDLVEQRLRKRDIGKTRMLTLTIRTRTIDGSDDYVEKKEKLMEREYATLKKLRDLSCQKVHVRKHSFVFAEQYFELGEYLSPPRLNGFWILETYCQRKTVIELPPSLKHFKKNVTDDPNYSLRSLAKRNPTESENI